MCIEETIFIRTTPETIFSVYEDVEGWRHWDADVVSASLSGRFDEGAFGVLIPAKGPKARFRLVEVERNSSFISETRLPLCCMRFSHHIRTVEGGAEVTHRVSFVGALSFLWGRLIGSQIRKGLPQALNGLKALCEKSR